MKAFLVTGNPGSGKSTVARELARRGFSTIDPDYDPELSYWTGPSGRRVLLADGPAAPDTDWLRSHRWVWSRSRMAELLASATGPVFVSGIALNVDEVLELFTGLFLLSIDEATQEARLVAHDQMHPPGRSEADRQAIRDGRVLFEAQMSALGARALNGAQPPNDIVEELLVLTGTRLSFELRPTGITSSGSRSTPLSSDSTWGLSPTFDRRARRCRASDGGTSARSATAKSTSRPFRHLPTLP